MATGTNKHLWFEGGAKTVCTSHVLAYFGIPAKAYHYSGLDKQRCQVLNRFGFVARSRDSHTKKASTVGQLRTLVKGSSNKWGDSKATHYMVTVICGNGEHHLILLDSEGHTVVDTAPVKRDRRKFYKVRAVFKK